MSRRLQLIEAQRFALAHAQPDPSALLRRIRELERENSGLRRQLEAGPETLRRVNGERQAGAERLREAIAAALARGPTAVRSLPSRSCGRWNARDSSRCQASGRCCGI